MKTEKAWVRPFAFASFHDRSGPFATKGRMVQKVQCKAPSWMVKEWDRLQNKSTLTSQARFGRPSA